MKAYIQAGNGIYGARVFIPYEHTYPAVIDRLNWVCKWGGADKDTGKCKSWEVQDNIPGYRFIEELTCYLVGFGFTVEKVGAGNVNEVWK